MCMRVCASQTNHDRDCENYLTDYTGDVSPSHITHTHTHTVASSANPYRALPTPGVIFLAPVCAELCLCVYTHAVYHTDCWQGPRSQ